MSLTLINFFMAQSLHKTLEKSKLETKKSMFLVLPFY